MTTYQDMLKKLDQMYNEEDILVEEIASRIAQLEQLKEDKELLQTMIMYKANKKDREKDIIMDATWLGSRKG